MAMQLQRDIALAPHTYFKIGGPADYFVAAKTIPELIEAHTYAQTQGLPVLVLGGGSNLLVSDQGFRGLVIKNQTSGISSVAIKGKHKSQQLDIKQVLIRAESGVGVNRLISYTLQESLAGLEEFLGLPGTVGGAVYNNSHHLGDLIGNHLHSVELLQPDGKVVSVASSELEFSYDYSRLHYTHEVVLSATFALQPGERADLVARSQAAVARRSATQPLGAPSSGCIFQNIPLSEALRLGTPNHTQSAGYLIDAAGLKGASVGGAKVSTIHANFIVSDGTATASDVLALIAHIQQSVQQKFQIQLKPEVIVVGEN